MADTAGEADVVFSPRSLGSFAGDRSWLGEEESCRWLEVSRRAVIWDCADGVTELGASVGALSGQFGMRLLCWLAGKSALSGIPQVRDFGAARVGTGGVSGDSGSPRSARPTASTSAFSPRAHRTPIPQAAVSAGFDAPPMLAEPTWSASGAALSGQFDVYLLCWKGCEIALSGAAGAARRGGGGASWGKPVAYGDGDPSVRDWSIRGATWRFAPPVGHCVPACR